MSQSGWIYLEKLHEEVGDMDKSSYLEKLYEEVGDVDMNEPREVIWRCEDMKKRLNEEVTTRCGQFS